MAALAYGSPHAILSAMRHDRSPHPVGYALAWREPMTPWQRQLRQMIVESVREVFATSRTWQEAASRIGTRYETIYHWRQACRELGPLRTTEQLPADTARHDSTVMAKDRKRGKPRKIRTSRS